MVVDTNSISLKHTIFKVLITNVDFNELPKKEDFPINPDFWIPAAGTMASKKIDLQKLYIWTQGLKVQVWTLRNLWPNLNKGAPDPRSQSFSKEMFKDVRDEVVDLYKAGLICKTVTKHLSDIKTKKSLQVWVVCLPWSGFFLLEFFQAIKNQIRRITKDLKASRQISGEL